MSNRAITIPDGVARLFPAVVVALAALVGAAVGAAVAIPRFRASTETVSAPVVQVQALPPDALSPSELPPPVVIATPDEDEIVATPVEDQPVATPVKDRTSTDSMPSAPVKVERRASKERVSEEHVVPKWTGDWQAMTAQVSSNREASAAPAASVPPAAAAKAAADAPSGATSDGRAGAPVTISGCLEMSIDGGTFRLADTEGANAPTVRSWRSGFLKKQAAPVELIDLGDRATARKYVGRRVTATGVLENRDMRVRTLQVSSNACN
jgi:hypothetical protein